VNALPHLRATAVVSVLVLTGCSAPHGQPHRGAETLAPNEVLEFRTLYANNCAGCHGHGGGGGAAMGLANPVYLAIVDDRSMRASIADGVLGTAMPAFAQAAGGMLTEKQIDALVDGIRSHWGHPGVLDGTNPPSYTPMSAGDVRRGAVAYQAFCQSCHGPDGAGGPTASAITNDAFLALTSEQALRTTVIAGRPEIGAPDWRGNVLGRPMSEQDVSDVVSWLVSHRVARPGRPYFTADTGQR